MIGKTNAVVGGGGTSVPMEKINLTLTTNQTSADDLLGATITLAYGEYSETLMWEGKTLTFDIMQYITYTLTFSSVSGYKTPATLELTAVADNVRQIDAQYQTEVVTVTVSADSGASVSGQTVTINGVTTTLTATGVVSQKVPYGTSYSVSVSSLSGYTSPATQTFTASQPSRTVSMVYEEIRLGVFIQDTTGKLWTSDAWDGSATPNGVAVLTDACEFVIALSEASSIPIDTNGYSSIMNLTIYSSSSNAIKDYSGSSNTTVMVSAYGDVLTEAAGYCRNFTFPNGKKSGYLGSAGEWQAAYDNKSAIATCMSKAGGTALNSSNHYWSSTRAENSRYDSEYDLGPFNRFWRLLWSNGSWNGLTADRNFLYARPFSAL